MASSHCFENPPALNPASGVVDVVDDFGGQKAYVAGSTGSKAAVVLISDAFGFEAPNLRKIADRVASSGYFVVVPDFLHGDPYDMNANNPRLWVQSHDPQKAFEEAKPVIAAIKEKGVSNIGAAGYIWGAKVVVELAKVHEIQAAVLLHLHPSLLTVDDIKEVRCPISILGAEIDKSTPPLLLKQFEQILSANSGIDHVVKIFPGVAHGWAVRYTDDDAAAVTSAEEALQNMIYWFNKYLN